MPKLPKIAKVKVLSRRAIETSYNAIDDAGFNLDFLALSAILAIRSRSRGGPVIKEPQNVPQALAKLFEFGHAGIGLDEEGKRRLLLFAFRLELGASAGDGETFVVKQLLNADHIFHVRATVGALAGVALGRLELGKLGFPEAQNVRGEPAEAADFANAEVKLVGNNDLARSFARGILGRFMHAPHGRRAAERILSRFEQQRQSKLWRSGGFTADFRG
jgi:hypothetical protein